LLDDELEYILMLSFLSGIAGLAEK